MILREWIAVVLDWTAVLALLVGLGCGALATIPLLMLLGRRR